MEVGTALVHIPVIVGVVEENFGAAQAMLVDKSRGSQKVERKEEDFLLDFEEAMRQALARAQ